MKDHNEVLRTLVTAGHEAYFVGGAVRDHLLGREAKDWDVTTAATPDEVRAVFPQSEFVGAHFGVSLVKTESGPVEVATYRLDGDYHDGRHPNHVKFTGNVREDLARRDFTINAILMDVDGNIIDYVDGKADIEKELVRCIGFSQERFKEDGLRLMRAVRFACQLGFSIEADTAAAMKSVSWNLMEISKERIAQELGRILTSGKAAYGVRLLQEALMFQYIAPALCALEGTPQNPKHHPEGDVLTHTVCLLKQLPKGCSLTLALATLFHDVGKPTTMGWKNGQPNFHGHEDVGALMTGDILRDLRYSNDVIDRVVFLVANHMKFMVAQDMRMGKLLRWIRQPGFDELLQLHHMDAMAGSMNLEHYHFVKHALDTVPAERRHPERLVTGSDILIRFNEKPGPHFKTILEALETEQLEGRVSTKDEAFEFVKGMLWMINESTL